MKFRTSANLLFLFFLLKTGINAQDIQFGQVYNNSLYLNPAMAGISPFSRAMAYNRTQWYNLNSKYISYQAGADHFIPDINSGLGGYLLYDQQGSSVLKTYEAQIQYAYEIVLSNQMVLRAGLQPGFVSREIDYATLIFPDQIDSYGNVSGTQADVPNFKQRVNYMDFSSGLMLYSSKWWGGYAAHHMNRPNQSFLSAESRLPVKHSVITGYKHKLNSDPDNEISITPTVYYKAQGKSDQLDAGVFGIWYKHLLSVWYRGLPGVKTYRAGLHNNESLIFMYGYKFPHLQACYSYDYTVSKLSPAGTGGVHEISLIYYFRKSKRKKPMKTLPCPELPE